MSDDQARRDRVYNAIGDVLLDETTRASRITALTDAVMAAYNEPEPTPQLLVDMAQAIANADHFLDNPVTDFDIVQARAALQVVLRKLRHEGWQRNAIRSALDIPESLVKALLNE